MMDSPERAYEFDILPHFCKESEFLSDYFNNLDTGLKILKKYFWAWS